MIKNEKICEQILSSVEILKESAVEIYELSAKGAFQEAAKLTDLFKTLLLQIGDSVLGLATEEPMLKEVHQGLILNLAHTIKLVERYRKTRCDKMFSKMEYQAIPLIDELFSVLYYMLLIKGDEEKTREYNQTEWKTLRANPYLEQSYKSGEYKYDVSIYVCAYNKLDYTKTCVEAIMKNTPEHINYELILMNHGSDDGTKEYFESIGCTKQLDFKYNNLKVSPTTVAYRIVEGEYYCMISNDVLVGANYLENMLNVMRSDPTVQLVVPTTTNIANLQSIPCDFKTIQEMFVFAEKNNVSDPYRWEVRTRLINPVEMGRSADAWTSEGVGRTPPNLLGVGFTDDVQGILIRRSGGKSVLAKDAFCYHYGQVTLKEEKDYLSEKNFAERRQAIKDYYGIDPWGTGFCYDPYLFERLPCVNQGQVAVLGINCGIGSNPLKVREKLKEEAHNLDCTITNITDNPAYEADLKGVGDEVFIVADQKELTAVLKGKQFDYILVEDAFTMEVSKKQLVDKLLDLLRDGGVLAVRTTAGLASALSKKVTVESSVKDWMICGK